jgi:uncharacterized protein YraI
MALWKASGNSNLRCILVVHGLSILSFSPAVADPAETTEPTVMRAAPSSRAKFVQSIPSGAQIDLNSCVKSWCYASWRDLFGYVPVRSIVVLPDGPPAYRPPPVIVAPFGWGWGYGWGPVYRGRRW